MSGFKWPFMEVTFNLPNGNTINEALLVTVVTLLLLFLPGIRFFGNIFGRLKKVSFSLKRSKDFNQD